MKGYGVVLARKPYPFILYPAHVVGVKFTRNLYKPHAEKFLRSFFQKATRIRHNVILFSANIENDLTREDKARDGGYEGAACGGHSFGRSFSFTVGSDFRSGR